MNVVFGYLFLLALSCKSSILEFNREPYNIFDVYRDQTRQFLCYSCFVSHLYCFVSFLSHAFTFTSFTLDLNRARSPAGHTSVPKNKGGELQVKKEVHDSGGKRKDFCLCLFCDYLSPDVLKLPAGIRSQQKRLKASQGDHFLVNDDVRDIFD